MLHFRLHDEYSKFLYLSAKLTLELNITSKNKLSTDYLEQLHELSESYENIAVKDRYPNCEVAIECLFSRYFYLTGDRPSLKLSQRSIKNKIEQLRGYEMFDEAFLFYVLYGSTIPSRRRQL